MLSGMHYTANPEKKVSANLIYFVTLDKVGYLEIRCKDILKIRLCNEEGSEWYWANPITCLVVHKLQLTPVLQTAVGYIDLALVDLVIIMCYMANISINYICTNQYQTSQMQ